MMGSSMTLAIFLVILANLLLIAARCPEPGYSACNCTELQKPDELAVSCDGLSDAAKVWYELDGLPQNQITELAIFRTKSLSDIRPDFFKKMSKLQRLSLAANPFSKIRLPEGLFDPIAKTLEALDLSTLNLTERDISGSLFASLTNLRELDLSFNQITQFRPDVFAALRNLEWLDIGDNRLTSLPPNLFRHNRKLKLLDINDNQLTKLPPDSFTDYMPITILDIGGNRIRDLSSSDLAMLPNLTALDLRKNPISPLLPDVFSYNRKLARLSLDGISAPMLPSRVFDRLPLESLDLSDLQNVRSLPEDLLEPIGATLKELQLDDNWNLKEIPPNFFAPAEKLEILDLSNTSLKLLPNGFFQQLRSLRRLKISDNPFLVSLPQPTGYSQQLKIIDYKNVPKFPPVVTKWINGGFDTTHQLMDFPINIFRSILRDIQLRIHKNRMAIRTFPSGSSSNSDAPRPENNRDQESKPRPQSEKPYDRPYDSPNAEKYNRPQDSGNNRGDPSPQQAFGEGGRRPASDSGFNGNRYESSQAQEPSGGRYNDRGYGNGNEGQDNSRGESNNGQSKDNGGNNGSSNGQQNNGGGGWGFGFWG